MAEPRIDGRGDDQLRRIEIQPAFTTNPAGSALIRFGRTMVLCTAAVEEGVPRFRRDIGGWLTAEYAMAPGSTHSRAPRESMRGKVKGRTHEIQRLIGRSVRAAIDLERIGEHTIHLDCEVLQADGGTRTAAVTGAFVALALACDKLLTDGAIPASPLVTSVAAVSCGIVDGRCLVDLCYEEDSRAEVDANLVLTGAGEIVEVQATGEQGTLSRTELNAMLDAGTAAARELTGIQRLALGEAVGRLGLTTLMGG
jgi:ribonuclease PH